VWPLSSRQTLAKKKQSAVTNKVLDEAIRRMRKYIFFECSFPLQLDSKVVLKKSLKSSAKVFSYVDVVTRITQDDSYTDVLANYVSAWFQDNRSTKLAPQVKIRVAIIRGTVKEAAMQLVVAQFDLQPGKVKRVSSLLKDYRYTFPLDRNMVNSNVLHGISSDSVVMCRYLMS
jgi:Domain of unknown function (DUF6532)